MTVPPGGLPVGKLTKRTLPFWKVAVHVKLTMLFNVTEIVGLIKLAEKVTGQLASKPKNTDPGSGIAVTLTLAV